jgi:hypothetical protein
VEVTAADAPRGRARSATESLLAVALALEAALTFFATLAIFGLRALEPVLAFVGGGVLFVALVLTTRLVRYRWGIAIGWVLQGVLLATGFLLPIMFVIAAGFVGIWIFCFVKGRQLDGRNRTL